MKVKHLCLFVFAHLSFNLCAQNNPNIIWIITDEHNFRTLGCYRDLLPPEQAFMWGKGVVETPNIDRLGKQGVLFTKMYTSSPVCSPNRASMFTGQYPHTVNVSQNNKVMDLSYPTIATVLSQHGYQTGYAGKWHLSGEAKPGWAPKPTYGFQDNRFMFNRGHWKKFGIDTHGQPYVASKDKSNLPSAALNNANEESFSTDWITDRMLKFINQNQNNPFFYVVSLPDPHDPNLVRAPYNTMYKNVSFNVPKSYYYKKTKDDPKWRHSDPKINNEQHILKMLPSYYGMVKCIDDNVGRLLAQLESLKLLDNTIILFSSDHGDMLGEHRRKNKGVPFEGSAKIPFLIHYPNGIRPGSVVRKAANATDWMETILSLAGVQNRPKTAGRDLTPLIKNPNLKVWDDITFLRIGGWVAAFDSQYKLVLDTGKSTSPWLLDLKADPNETTNYINSSQHERVLKHLARKLQQYIVEQNDPHYKNGNIMGKLQKLIGEGS